MGLDDGQRNPLLPLQPRRSQRFSPGWSGLRQVSFPADDYVEVGIDLNEQLIRHPQHLLLRVSGQSMITGP